jgi:hypothetical protein
LSPLSINFTAEIAIAILGAKELIPYLADPSLALRMTFPYIEANDQHPTHHEDISLRDRSR